MRGWVWQRNRESGSEMHIEEKEEFPFLSSWGKTTSIPMNIKSCPVGLVWCHQSHWGDQIILLSPGKPKTGRVELSTFFYGL